MAETSTIEWTDATWNVITGCSIKSPGCRDCYAMKLAGTRLRNHPSRAGLTIATDAGPVWNGQVRFNRQWLEQPVQWTRPRDIFVCAHGDLFHERVPFEWLDSIFDVMRRAPRHRFQCLTKRPEVALQYLRDWRYGPMPHVLIGASVERKQEADERRPLLEQIAARGWTTWVSYEPAIGPVDWTGWEFIRWMVSGGESGSRARPSHPDWHRSTRDWCARHGVAYHFKQWGNWKPLAQMTYSEKVATDERHLRDDEYLRLDGSTHTTLKDDHEPFDSGDILIRRVGKKAAGRLLDGVQHDGFPETTR